MALSIVSTVTENHKKNPKHFNKLCSLGVLCTNTIYHQNLSLAYSTACSVVHHSLGELYEAIESCRGEREAVKIFLQYLWPHIEEDTQRTAA